MSEEVVKKVVNSIISDSCGLISERNDVVLSTWINWLVESGRLDLEKKSVGQLCYEVMSRYNVIEDISSTSLLVNGYNLGESKVLLNEQYPDRVFILSGTESNRI